MKTYHLTILYQAGNLKSEKLEVRAERLSVTNGALVFYNKNNDVTAVYPANSTIIKEII